MAQQTNSLWGEIDARADRLAQIIRDNTPQGELAIPQIPSFILQMFWRSFRLYDAILVLLKAGLPEESAFLARSLFEDSLRLESLAEANEQDRYALILGWLNQSIDEKCGLIKEAKRLGLDSNIDPILASLTEERRKLQLIAPKYGVKKLKFFPPVRDLAFNFKRKDDYWTYRWAHESVHGSDAAWLFARETIGKNNVRLRAKTNDGALRAAFAEFASVSMANAAQATFKIFKWQCPPEVKELTSEMFRLIEESKE